MRRHEELMERLAAADPVRDREPLTPEAQREADALLARLLAIPAEPAAAPRRPRSQLRRRALAVAGAACAALAAFAAIDLVDSDAPGPGVVDRAVAAVMKAGSVYHVVEQMTFRAEGARGASQELYFESWYTPDGRLHRKTFTVRDGQKGRLVEDFAGQRRPGRANGSALQWDASSNTIGESGFAGGDLAYLGPFEDPSSRLRTLREQGRLRMAGTTTVDGTRAYRLVTGRFAADEEKVSIDITVDAETYLPLSQRLSIETAAGQTTETLTRYRAYERLALNDESRGRLALDPHPAAKCSELAHELTEDRDLGFPNPCAAGRPERGRNP
jgi:hypothetical protein